MPKKKQEKSSAPKSVPEKKKEKKQGLLSRIFGSSKKKQKEEAMPPKPTRPAPVPMPPKPAGPAPKPSPDVQAIVQRENTLINETCFSAVGDKVTHPLVQPVTEAYFYFKGTVDSAVIPTQDDPSFKTKLGKLNESVMTEHANFLSECISASQGLAAAASQPGADPGLIQAAMGLSQIASLLHTQELKLNKIYDDVMTAYIDGDTSQFSGKNYRTLFAQTEVYSFRPGEAKPLGKGGINTVYKDEFQGKERVFKQGQTHVKHKGDINGEDEDFHYVNTELDVFTSRLGHERGTLSDYEGDSRIGVRDANTANRDVAVSRINKLLGFDIVVNTQLARGEDGQASSLMDLARGQTAKDSAMYSGQENEGAAMEWARRTMIEERDKLRKSGQIDDAEKIEKGGFHKEAIDLTDPTFVMDMFKMSVIDIIVGHVDRHTGNFLLRRDEDGKSRVTAIDNDTSFGLDTDVDEKGDSEYESAEKIRASIGKTFPFVPKELRDRIFSVSESDISAALTGLLSKPQIEAACVRFSKLREAMKGIKLVDESGSDATRDQYESLYDKEITGFGTLRNQDYFAALVPGHMGKLYEEQEANRGKGKEPQGVPIPAPRQRIRQ